MIVLTGRAVSVIDGEQHELGPGDTSWIAPDAARTLVATGETRPVAAEHAPDRMLPST